jgi:hypothetical protein
VIYIPHYVFMESSNHVGWSRWSFNEHGRGVMHTGVWRGIVEEGDHMGDLHRDSIKY